MRLRVVQLLRAVAERNGQENGGQIAAALTYYAFVSIFPLMLLALSVIGFVLSGDEAAQQEWAARLAGSIPGLGDLIARNITAIVEGRTAAGVVALLGLLWAGMGIVGAARTALSRIFRRALSANPILSRMRTLGALAILGVVALGSVTITGLLAGLGGEAGIGLIVRIAGILGAAAVDLGFFLLAYLVLTPGHGPRPATLLPGAIVMAAGWTGLKLAGSWYAARVVARATAIYGTFAAVIGILAILNIAAQLFVAGAVLSAVLAERRSGGTGVL
jgi:inner membrane protein YhjD